LDECNVANPDKLCLLQGQCKQEIVTPPEPRCTIQKVVIERSEGEVVGVRAYALAEITCHVESKFTACDDPAGKNGVLPAPGPGPLPEPDYPRHLPTPEEMEINLK
jgi:hypothetical protein